MGKYAINLRGLSAALAKSYTLEYRTSRNHLFKLYGKIPVDGRSFVLVLPYAKYEFRVNATWLRLPWPQLEKEQTTLIQATVGPVGESDRKNKHAHPKHEQTFIRTHSHIHKLSVIFILLIRHQ